MGHHSNSQLSSLQKGAGRPDDPSAIQLIQPWFCSWNGSIENYENVERGRGMPSGASPATARMCSQERVLADVGQLPRLVHQQALIFHLLDSKTALGARGQPSVARAWSVKASLV